MKPRHTWEQFGPALARKREELGLYKNQAAIRAGVSPSTWTQVERGYSTNRGRQDDYPPTREFIVKAVKALGNWDLAEALTLGGYAPERLPVDDMEPTGPTKMLRIWNRLSKQQQRALEWTMQLMVDPHASLVDAPAPASDPARPVFTDAPQSSRSKV